MDRPAACTVRASGVIIVTADEGGGVTANPAGEWTVQQARDLGMSLGERFEDIGFVIRDRGSDFTSSFDAVFQATGAGILRTAVQPPRMNAICERLAGTLRGELLTAC